MTSIDQINTEEKGKIEQVKTYILLIVKGLVKNPDDVSIYVADGVLDKEEEIDGTVEKKQIPVRVFKVQLHKADIGLCIGRAGTHAEAIRRLATAFAIDIAEYHVPIVVRVDIPHWLKKAPLTQTHEQVESTQKETPEAVAEAAA